VEAIVQILLVNELMVATKDGRCEMRKAGETLSVYHRVGRRLIHGRQAKWICAEDGDPRWIPIPGFRAVRPEHDKMIRSALNK